MNEGPKGDTPRWDEMVASVQGGPVAGTEHIVTHEEDFIERAMKLGRKLERELRAKTAELEAQRNLAGRLKLEAKMHAQEARTANATIAEIYQLCTGATGEPGNWHGAEPVRKVLAELDACRAALDYLTNNLTTEYPTGVDINHPLVQKAYAAIDAARREG